MTGRRETRTWPAGPVTGGTRTPPAAAAHHPTPTERRDPAAEKEDPMFTDLPDLAVRSLGGTVMAANDESFAEKECLIRDAEPDFTPNSFGSKGQIYDGWETRRRREPGHDWALIRLGVPGIVHGLVVDTAHFRGNYPPQVSIDGVALPGYPSVDELLAADWRPLAPATGIDGHTRNPCPATEPRYCTHVRLNLLPDGGVARLRVHGEPLPDPDTFAGLPFDLAALANGGRVHDVSNQFYSRPTGAIMPGLSTCQADGWETGRRRKPGNEWLRLRLAARGRPVVAELDTSHLKFNAPDAATLHGYDAESGADIDDPSAWFPILTRTRLQPDTAHRFRLDSTGPVTHVRLDVHPDGGIARIRLIGEPTEQALNRWRADYRAATTPQGEPAATRG